VFNNHRGYEMSNGKFGGIGLIVVGVVIGLVIGVGLWDSGSEGLNSITHTFEEMAAVENIGSQGRLNIKYPLLVHSKHNEQTRFKVTVMNTLDSEQEFRVEFRSARTNMPPVDIPPWHATVPGDDDGSGNVLFPSFSTPSGNNEVSADFVFVHPASGYAFIRIYMNGVKVGEIIFISE
jgi:hypothetical protein